MKVSTSSLNSSSVNLTPSSDASSRRSRKTFRFLLPATLEQIQWAGYLCLKQTGHNPRTIYILFPCFKTDFYIIRKYSLMYEHIRSTLLQAISLSRFKSHSKDNAYCLVYFITLFQLFSLHSVQWKDDWECWKQSWNPSKEAHNSVQPVSWYRHEPRTSRIQSRSADHLTKTWSFHWHHVSAPGYCLGRRANYSG